MKYFEDNTNIKEDFELLELRLLTFRYLGAKIDGVEMKHVSQLQALKRVARKMPKHRKVFEWWE